MKLKQFTCLNAPKSQVISSRKVRHWPLGRSRSEIYPKTSHLLFLFCASWSCWGRGDPNFLLISAETCGVISGSLRQGDKNSHCQGQWGLEEHFWFLLLNPTDCLWLCPRFRVALGKEVALKKDCSWRRKKDKINKLSCVCLLYVIALWTIHHPDD